LDACDEDDVEPCQLKLDAFHENDVVSRQLSFADDVDTLAAQKEELAVETTEEELAAELARTAAAELAACLAESDGAAIAVSCVATPEKPGDAKKSQGLPFDVTQIPSPTRNRALKKQLFAASSVPTKISKLPAEGADVPVPDDEFDNDESKVPDDKGSELTMKLQSRRNVVDTEGTTWQKLPEVALTDASNIDVWKSSEQGWARRNEVQQTRMEDTKASSKEPLPTTRRPSQRDFTSPGREGALGRMLQGSATPQKQNGEKLQAGRRSLPHGTTRREKEVAMHRAAAFEAWGSSPAPAPRTDSFKYQ